MKKALIIDDEEQARLYLAEMIRSSFPDIVIHFASTPAEALFILNKPIVDILFLDVEMPGMSGLEMLQVLREKHRDIPVIVVSAYNTTDFVRKALRLGVVDYLDKPVNPDELETAINKACRNEKSFMFSMPDNKLSFNTSKGTLHIEPERILFFRSDKRNSQVSFTDEKGELLVRKNLVNLEKILPKSLFIRVSRQHIINIANIKYVDNKNNEIILQACNNREVTLSKIFPHIIEKYTK